MKSIAAHGRGAVGGGQTKPQKQSYVKRLGHDIKKHKMIYAMAIPVILY